MKTLLTILLVILVSCGESKEPKPAPTPTVEPSPTITPSPIPTSTPIPTVTPTPPPPTPTPIPPTPTPTPTPVPPPPPCDTDFTKALGLQPNEGQPVLIGGKPADIKDWPASVYIRSGNSACSATVIGSRVVLSAAHCMSNNGKINFNVGSNSYKGTCTHHPDYKKNSTADWALCLVERPVTGILFENVSSELNFAVGDTVRLTGYGCISSSGSGGNDGVFRTGSAVVTALPKNKDYDTTTKGGAALCFGDSGGAAYLEMPDGKREVFAVNSRGDIKTYSYLSSIFVETAQNFLEDFIFKNQVEICGVSTNAEACRSYPTPPPAKWDFEVNSNVACVRGRMHKGQETKKQTVIEKIQSVLNSLFSI